MTGATQAVRARNSLAEATKRTSAPELTEAIILIDRWLSGQSDYVKRDLERYFGREGLPVAARILSEEGR